LSRTREIQVGLTVVVALGITLWGVTWLKQVSLARRVRVWHVTFPQTGGLSTSDEVQVNGLRKGSVQSVALISDHVSVDLALASEVVLTSDSRVSVRNVGLMGEKVIAVDLHASGVPYTSRDTIPGIYEKGIPEVVGGMSGTVDAIAELATQLKGLADAIDKNGNLTQTLVNLHDTSEQLKAAVVENRTQLRVTLANLNAASKTAKALTTDREAELRKALESFERTAAGLERLTTRLDSLRTTMQSVAGKVDRGDGTLGKLVNDPKLYEEAKQTVTELKTLIADIKANPKKYLNVKVF
jgi:phospholipid/cholesterol/gamma-HCH transport system substrate-binding protein